MLTAGPHFKVQFTSALWTKGVVDAVVSALISVFKLGSFV